MKEQGNQMFSRTKINEFLKGTDLMSCWTTGSRKNESRPFDCPFVKSEIYSRSH